MNSITSKFTLLTFLFIGLLSSGLTGQTTAKNPVQKNAKTNKQNLVTRTHKSDLLKREMSYRMIFPKDYNIAKSKKFAVLYLLHGLTGNYTNWSDKSNLKTYSTNHDLIIVMPDANNSWYTDSSVIENDKFESYIVNELIPTIDKDFRTKANRENRIIAGLSMGGYGSLKFGIKYPDKFGLVGSFSGALRAAEWNGKDFAGWKVLTDSISNAFGEMNGDTRKANDIFKILEAKSRDELGKLPFFYLDCGTEDGLLKQNQDFAKLLQEQKVPHEFRQLPGKHDWKFWDAQIQEFLELSKKYIN